MDPQWIIAIASCFAALGIVFVARQTHIANKQLSIATEQLRLSAEQHRIASEQLSISAEQHKISVAEFKADHERSRRERAIDVLARWTSSLDKAHPSARTLVESFDHEQCEKLRQKKGFRIGKDKEDLVKNVLHGYLDEGPPKSEENTLTLDDNHAAHIYYLCISHLNSLEIALQSWLVRVADDKILENELQYLIRPEKNHYVLEKLREVLGGKDCYPAIHEFVEHIKTKKMGGSERRQDIA